MPETTLNEQRRTREGDGRDEMNLADWPISVLQWQQPQRPDGSKVQSASYESSRYDPATRKRTTQRVTLSSEEGLPTSADERVVVGLLWLAKHTNGFADPRVPFQPGQLLRVLRWPANSQHYTRLRGALRRLKALTLRFENAWWDAEGRQYEGEFATGIIASYRLARQVRGRKKASAVPTSYVEWHPDFFRSLKQGNLKRLDLDRLFALRLPIAQRMYRFLDKRFYGTASVELDLYDFACGHIGITRTDNIAELKRRLAPAIAELEAIDFIRPAPLETRFQKLGRGVWRVRFDRAVKANPATPAAAENEAELDADGVVRTWHRLWHGRKGYVPTTREIVCARSILTEYGSVRVAALLPRLVERMREKWPGAKSFLAVQAYVGDVVEEDDQQRARDAERRAERTRQREEAAKQRDERQRRRAVTERWQPVWDVLGSREQEDIRQAVIGQLPFAAHGPNILHLRCLEELARRRSGGNGRAAA